MAEENNRIKLAIIGSRGIPARYGGFETFTERIAESLCNKGVKTVVYCMSHLRKESFSTRGIKRAFIPTLKISFVEKFILSSLSILHATFIEKVDIIISISTTGGALLWIPRLFSKKIIISFDGIEWRRKKWNRIISFALKTLEFLSVKFADVIVADSKAIGEYIGERYKKNSIYIPYGSDECIFTEEDWKETKQRFTLSPKSYYLAVGRSVPENNFDMIIKGFLNSNSDKQLVIVSDKLLRPVEDYYANGKVIFTGPIYDRKKLFALRKNAFVHIHGHSVGGTNPSLLEAIASGNLIICYDVPYNKEVIEEYAYYFKDEIELASLINCLENNQSTLDSKHRTTYYQKILKERYNWEFVSDKYLELIKYPA